MLASQKSIWFENIFAIYNRNLIKRRFNSVQICGLNEITKRNQHQPLIIYVNHSSWWDGLVAFEISHKAKLASFIMMEEKQLKKLFLFRRLGAFSVVRENARKAMESLDYAAGVLRQNCRNVLWVFPQGEILPNDKRPLQFYNGLSKIVKKSGKNVQFLPIAIRYEFLGDFKPEIFIKIGKLESTIPDENFDTKKFTRYLAQNLTEILDDLRKEIVSRDFSEFERLI
ncbi:MAG: lysophospholipid acyltransferase family protein [Acidobacteriota bacterium]|nr:lysophospholipid acyltransferase family protein [Acidobacteriota bacterium]